MVGKIIRSEYVLNRNVVLIFIVEIVALTTMYSLLLDGGGVILAFVSLLTGLIPVMILARSSKFKADDIVCSLPLSRNRIIAGKYAFIGTVMAGAIVLAFFTVAVIPHPEFSTMEIFRIDGLVNALFVMVLIAGVISPLVIRFGFIGVLVFILGANLLLVGVLILTALGLISNALDFVFRGIPEGLRELRMSLGGPAYNLLLIAASAAAAFLSLKCSQAIYRRKEF